MVRGGFKPEQKRQGRCMVTVRAVETKWDGHFYSAR